MQQSTLKEGNNKAYWLQHHAAAGKDLHEFAGLLHLSETTPDDLAACLVLRVRRSH